MSIAQGPDQASSAEELLLAQDAGRLLSTLANPVCNRCNYLTWNLLQPMTLAET